MSFAERLARARSAPRDADAAALLAQAALAEQEEAAALPIVSAAAAAARTQAQLWQWTGLLHRALDQHADALRAFNAAAMLAPGDALIAHGRARIAIEAGLPASGLFETALRLAPDNGEIRLGLAAARFAEGEAMRGMAELDSVLAANPRWAAGHASLAQLRWMMGEREAATASYERALSSVPGDHALWQSLIVTLVQGGRFAEALDAILRGRGAAGEARMFDANEAVVRSEAGAADAAEALFAKVGAIDDTSFAVRRVRHLLRTGRAEQALPLIERWTAVPDGALMWPYASIAWRITGDARLGWLEGQPGLVGIVDLADRLPPLDRLADLLRGLHRARSQHLDQSVRGGTQTDGHLLSRVEPEIRALRAAIVAAVSAHVAALPPIDPAHPMLRFRRDRVPRFSGSWSVRLMGQGHHANHIHPAGWISSALYVALPPDRAGEAGWLTLGEPQAELGLDLPPIRTVEPRPGRLVLFPSTMWHGTVPFEAGERLTVAFDIAPPLGVPA